MEAETRKSETDTSDSAVGPTPPFSILQSQRNGSPNGEMVSVRQRDVAKHCPLASHEKGSVKPLSYSLGTMAMDVGQRVKRTTTRTLSGHTGSYRVDSHGVPSELLLHPYQPQSKGNSYMPKKIFRSMGTTSLPRQNPSTYALDTAMVKSDAERHIQQCCRPKKPMMSADGVSPSHHKYSCFPADNVDHVYYPPRSAVCLQAVPQQRPGAYHSPHPDRRGDFCRKPSLSSVFKRKWTNGPYGEQKSVEEQQQTAMQAYNQGEFRKQQWATAGSYPGVQRWVYNERYRGQEYAVHVVQETGRKDAFREGGDTAIVKSAGDSSSKFVTVPIELDQTFVFVRDARTGGDTPLPPLVTGEPAMEAAAILNGGVQKEDKASACDISTASEGNCDYKIDSESESDSKAESESTSTIAVIQRDEAASEVLLPEVHAAIERLCENEAQSPLQESPEQPIQQQHLLAPMAASLKYTDHQEKHYQRRDYCLPYQPTEQMMFHQERRNTQKISQDHRSTHTAPSNVGDGEVPIRVPPEGASLRSFQSQFSVGTGSVGTAEDGRSLQSRNSIRTPLLRPNKPGMSIDGGNRRKSFIFIAFNVILFGVLIGVVAGFIMQEVVKS